MSTVIRHVAAFFSAALLIACCGQPSVAKAGDPSSDVPVWGYCEFARVHTEFGLPLCVAGPRPPGPDWKRIQFCCTPPDGPCVETTLLGNCDPDDYVVICEWGRTLTDGTIECYD